MELSQFLAQLIGLTMVLFALAALCRPQFVPEVMAELQDSALVRLLYAFIALTMGLMIILTHNVWVGDWRVAITLIGWGAVLKGFAAIAMPNALVSLGRTFYNSTQRTRTVLIAAGLFGVYLAAVGFGWL